MIRLNTYARNGGPMGAQAFDQVLLAIEAALNAQSGGVALESWSQDPETLEVVFTFSDGKAVGPLVLPAGKTRLRGEWQTLTVYAVNDRFSHEGSSYDVVAAHASSTVAADLAAGRIQVAAAKGEDAGFGDAPEDGRRYVRLDAAWVVDAPGVDDAPADGDFYVRQDGEWVPVPADDVGEAPADGKLYGRKDEDWAEVVIPVVPAGIEWPADGKTYGVRDGAPVEIPPPGTTGGVADAWTFETFFLGQGAYVVSEDRNGVDTPVVHAQFVADEDLTWVGGADRTLLVSKAADQGHDFVLRTGGVELVRFQPGLGAPGVVYEYSRRADDLVVPAGQVVELILEGPQYVTNLTDPVLVRLALRRG